MMNPRSAPVASMAESITSTSTSSSTREEPSPRSRSSSVVSGRKSTRPDAWLSRESAPSSARNTISALPLRPSRILSLWRSGRSVTCSSFTNVPQRDPRSFNRNRPSSRRTISACSRDTSVPTERRSLSLFRPMRNTGLSMRTTRGPSGSFDLKARRSDVGGFRHGHTGFAFSTPISIRNPVKSYTRRS